MVDCYTDYYFSDNSEGTGTASLIIADHNILTTMSFIYTEREKKINQNKYVSKMESSTTLTHYWPLTLTFTWPDMKSILYNSEGMTMQSYVCINADKKTHQNNLFWL